VWAWGWFLTRAELSDLESPQADEPPQGYIHRTLILLRYRFRARVLQCVGLGLLIGGNGLWVYFASWGWRWRALFVGSAVCISGIALLGHAGIAAGRINRALRKLGTHDDLP
jgi:hypothetical protein